MINCNVGRPRTAWCLVSLFFFSPSFSFFFFLPFFFLCLFLFIVPLYKTQDRNKSLPLHVAWLAIVSAAFFFWPVCGPVLRGSHLQDGPFWLSFLPWMVCYNLFFFYRWSLSLDILGAFFSCMLWCMVLILEDGGFWFCVGLDVLCFISPMFHLFLLRSLPWSSLSFDRRVHFKFLKDGGFCMFGFSSFG